MKSIIGMLIILIFICGCAEQLPEVIEPSSTEIPEPDYTALEQEYQSQQQSILQSRQEGSFDGAVAIVRIEGIIDTEDVMPVAQALREIGEDPLIQGVLLWVDSPGGSVSAVTQITYEIERLKSIKPIVAYSGGLAASGGYYIMSVCDQIVVRPDAEIGSIGVIFVHVDASGYYAQYGFNIEVIKTGIHKDAGADWRSLDDVERQLITDSVYDAFYRFVYTVGRGRNLSRKTVEDHADGFTWFGMDAVTWGFADMLGNLDDAIQQLEQLIGLQKAELIFFQVTEEGESDGYSWESVQYLYTAQLSIPPVSSVKGSQSNSS
jgi:protease-4